MAGFLKKIKAKDLVLNEADTKSILIVFFPHKVADIKKTEVNNNHRAFAQALLIEAVDANKKLEVMKAIAEFAYGHNPMKLIKILDVVTKAAEVIYEYKKPTEISKKLIDDSELSQEVINQLRKNFKYEIDSMISGEGNIYLDSNLKQNDKKTKLSDNQELENSQNKTAQWKPIPLNIE